MTFSFLLRTRHLMWLRPVSATLGLVLAPLVLLGCTDTETPPGTGIPVLTAISPATATAGSPALTLTLSGEIFYDFSVVRWAGGALQTTFVSDTELRAEVPANLLVSPGSFDVTVETTAPGGGTSASKAFIVQSPVIGGVLTPAPGTPTARPTGLNAQGVKRPLVVRK